MDMKLGTWNVRNVYRAGSVKTATSELEKYNLNLVAVQQVRRVEGGSQPADDYTFFHGNEKANHHLGTGFFIHKGIRSAVKTVEFISDRLSHITLGGHWCDIIVPNVHAATEDNSDDTNNSFYKELEHVFNQFLKYHMKILLGDFNAKIGREDVFKSTVGMGVYVKSVMIMGL
jgi:exonuclease III